MKTIDQITDYKEASAILNEEYAALNWNGTAIHGEHLATDDSGWKHYAFQVAFQPPYKTPVFFDWKNGVGHVRMDAKGKPLFPAIPTKPNPAEVLGRVCADYLSAACETFTDWSANFGYDEDSRKAHRIYEECQALGSKLRALGLTSAQIQRFGALAEML